MLGLVKVSYPKTYNRRSIENPFISSHFDALKVRTDIYEQNSKNRQCCIRSILVYTQV